MIDGLKGEDKKKKQKKNRPKLMRFKILPTSAETSHNDNANKNVHNRCHK